MKTNKGIKTAHMLLEQSFFLPELTSYEIYRIYGTDTEFGFELNIILGLDGDMHIYVLNEFFLPKSEIESQSRYFFSGCALMLLFEAIRLDTNPESRLLPHEETEEMDEEVIVKSIDTVLRNPIRSYDWLVEQKQVSVIHDDNDGDMSQTLELEFTALGIKMRCNHMYGYGLRFRTQLGGGGSYPRIHTALRLLCFAILLDNNRVGQ